MNPDEIARCERECTRLCIDFAWAVDRFEYDAFVALFAPDGAFERPGLVSRGAVAIRSFLDARPRDRTTRHLLTNVRIESTGPENASGTCSALLYQAAAPQQPHGPLPVPGPLVVDWVDAFVLTPVGWRFGHRKTTVVFEPSNV